MSRFIAGVYADSSEAKAALSRLLSAHFDSEDIRVFVPGPERGQVVAVRRKSGSYRCAAIGAGLGAILGALSIELIRSDVLSDPGVLSPNLGLTLLRGIFVAASIGALAGYVAGLGVWSTSIEFARGAPSPRIVVGVSVSAQRLDGIRDLIRGTTPSELVECDSEEDAQATPLLRL